MLSPSGRIPGIKGLNSIYHKELSIFLLISLLNFFVRMFPYNKINGCSKIEIKENIIKYLEVSDKARITQLMIMWLCIVCFFSSVQNLPLFCCPISFKKAIA